MNVQPYLSFEGRCEEAIEFYRKALGAEVVQLLRFKDAPPQAGMTVTPGTENKVMHCALRIGEATVMASDGRCGGSTSFQGTTLTLSLSSDAEAEHAYKALVDGGKAFMPLAKTFFASSFGMINDRFGVPWMILVPQEPPRK
jgi:PhnB protein